MPMKRSMNYLISKQKIKLQRDASKEENKVRI